MGPGPVRIALLVVAALLAGGAGGWLARGADGVTTDVVQGWGFANADGTQVACCSDTPGGEGRGYSAAPTWYDATAGAHPVNRPCLGAPSTSRRVRMRVVRPDDARGAATVLWVECLSEPQPASPQAAGASAGA